MSRARDLADLGNNATGLETLTVSDVTDLSVSASNINSATNQITDSSTDLNVDSNTLVVDKSANSVGIGESVPLSRLHIKNTSGNDGIRIVSSTTDEGYFIFGNTVDTNIGSIAYNHTANAMRFTVDNAESMRIDSSGTLLVGMQSDAANTVGVRARKEGFFSSTRDGSQSAIFGRKTSDGNIVLFQKDGTTVGSIGAVSGRIFIGSDSVQETYIGFNNNYIYPADNDGAFKNNVIDLGNASARFNDIYLGNAPNVPSDRNKKQDIEELSEAERKVAVACKGLMRKFRWKDAVAEKGDEARIHFGIIAQDLQSAFEAEGLDAGRYGMFMSNTWWEKQTEVPAVEAQDAVYETQTDEEGNEVQVLVSEAVEAQEAYTRTETYDTEEGAPEGAIKKERMGVRYSELLAFIISAI